MTNLKPFSGSRSQSRVLLSIKPQFASAIFHGAKRYEFRRTIFSRRVDVVLLYVSAPVQRVVAEFDVLSVISAPLTTLWKKTRQYAGIDKTYFLNYFEGLDIGHAIKIGEIRKYKEPFCPVKELGLSPPQSFSYLRPLNEVRSKRTRYKKVLLVRQLIQAFGGLNIHRRKNESISILN